MEGLEHFKGGSNRENPWPLEKKMIFYEVDYGKYKYEFCLDMWDTPRVWMNEVLFGYKGGMMLVLWNDFNPMMSLSNHVLVLYK